MEVALYSIVILLFLTLCLPLRLAYIALLLLVFFDASGPEFASASSLGLANAAKVLLGPLIILFRTRLRAFQMLSIKNSGWALAPFSILIVYTALATLWSPFPLSGAKMVGYWIGHLLWFAALAYGINRGYIAPGSLAAVAILGVFIGAFQTYILGAPYTLVSSSHSSRFTAFVSPQGFAAFYGYLFALSVFGYLGRFSFAISWLSLAAILASGSRYTLLVSLWVLVIWITSYFIRSRTLSTLIKRSILLSLLLFGMGMLIFMAPSSYLRQSRLSEIAYLFSGEIENIGTFYWRLGIYNHTIYEIKNFNAFHFIFGKGTSSGALVAINLDPFRYDSATIDANRVIHNEFLRALYEWGIIGISLLVLCLVMLAFRAIRLIMLGRKEGYFMLSVFVLILGGLSVENILAGSGTPVGIGLALALSLALQVYMVTRVSGKQLRSSAGVV